MNNPRHAGDSSAAWGEERADYLVGEKLRSFAGAARHDGRVRARAAAVPCGDLASVHRVPSSAAMLPAEADRAHAVSRAFYFSCAGSGRLSAGPPAR